MELRTLYESRRGCGFRKPGGLYLRSGPGPANDCGKLPLALESCPTCASGFKPHRGWGWLDTAPLFDPVECRFQSLEPHARDSISRDEISLACGASPSALRPFLDCVACPLRTPAVVSRAALLWIGEQFYPTVEDFQAEAEVAGISRRIRALPKGFDLGRTWVCLAHRKAIERLPVRQLLQGAVGELSPEEALASTWVPGIFRVFRPQAVEYVVNGTETEEELGALRARGIEPVRVVAVTEAGTELPFAAREPQEDDALPDPPEEVPSAGEIEVRT